MQNSPENFNQPESREPAEIPEWKMSMLATLNEIEERVEQVYERTEGKTSWPEALLCELATFQGTIDFYQKDGVMPKGEYDVIQEKYERVVEDVKKYKIDFEARGKVGDPAREEEILEKLFAVLG